LGGESEGRRNYLARLRPRNRRAIRRTMAASTMLRPTLPSTVEISKKEFIRFLGGPVVEPVTAC
jgi:hypothetical protein